MTPFRAPLSRPARWPPARWVRRRLRRARRRWRRSLRIRVVASTVLLGLIVVVAVGNVMLLQIRDGLIDSRTDAAERESARLTRQARSQIASSVYTDEEGLAQFMNQLVASLAAAGDETDRAVILRRSASPDADGPPGLGSTDIRPEIIPADLRSEVNSSARQQTKLIEAPGPGGVDGPALAVGTLIDIRLAGPYELYFVYPLEREEEILGIIRRAFFVGGFALVLLVGAVAYVVTRQVVVPVRAAALTAEQLAAGHLDRRVPVRGEDDLARLARAFNDMAASLERQILRLEDLSRVQRRFVSDVSHELRTPLTTIRMASEVIHEARADLDPVVSRSAELLQAQLDRFEALLGDLLEISRFDAGAVVLEPEPADLRDVVVRVVEALAPLAERRDTPVRVSSDNPCMAEVDTRRVERILRNLVGNAIEHGEGRPVEVSVAGDAAAVAVSVRDHGVGLDPADAAMVFERFWRADPARARATGGTGLGLAIALEDAHLHGGWLEAWGEPGVGANFRLTLPRHAGQDLVASPLPLVPPPSRPVRLGSGFPVDRAGYVEPETRPLRIAAIAARVAEPAGGPPAGDSPVGDSPADAESEAGHG